MNSPVSVQRTEGIAVLTVDFPPANAMAAPVRAAFLEAFEAEDADPETRAIVIAARGRSFATGPDPAEYEQPSRPPNLADLTDRIEAADTPVIAALHGKVLGGGLELAMAAHYRIADRRAELGMPDITLGVGPGAGGTQRLPRLVGPGVAADMILTGRRIDAASAVRAGLVDEVSEGPLPVHTLKAVHSWLGQGLTARPTAAMSAKLRPAKAHLDQLALRREKLGNVRLPAFGKVLDSIEATILLPFEAGKSFERAAFEDLVTSPEARALRHAQLAERRTVIPPLDAPADPLKIASVGVVGGGLMGSGIAAACLDAGLPVTLVEPRVERLEAAVDNIIDIFDRQVARKRLDAEARDARIGRLNGQTDLAALAQADLVIEATSEDADVKRQVFAALDTVLKQGAVLATSTSTIDIDGLAALTRRPEAVLGLHFVPPAHVIRLCEVVIAVDTSDAVIATAFAFLRRIGKLPVAAGVSEGYVAGRVLGACAHAAEVIVADGAPIQAVDAAMREFGFAMGPFEMADLSGLDQDIARRTRFDASAPGIAERLVGIGRIGRRVGRGYYSYRPEREKPEVDGDVTAILAEMRALRGAPLREFSPEDIRRRCLAAMANEGARLVDEGIAQRPSDIDIAMIAGYGFPRFRGGPMMHADLTGLLRIKRDIDAFAESDPVFWAPSPLIVELVKYGRSFADLNR